jgi:hypothetical protein
MLLNYMITNEFFVFQIPSQKAVYQMFSGHPVGRPGTTGKDLEQRKL